MLPQWVTLCLLLLCYFSCDSHQMQENTTPNFQITTMTYNIRHGAGSDGVVNLERISQVIRSAEPDLVAIQEVDRFVARTERVDQATILAEQTGMHMAFGFADNYQGGDFGNVILSRFPIDSLALHPLPGPPGETRVLMEAKIIIPQGQDSIPVTFMATHLETFETPRRASAPLINQVIPEMPDELYILGGDLNAQPSAPTLDTLSRKLINPIKSSPLLTHPADNPTRQIDYLLYQGPPSWTVDSVYVIDAPISSDHAPLVTIFGYSEQ